ncbi:MAG: glycoside hydrolase family 6 protein [Actinomycetes bacterium]
MSVTRAAARREDALADAVDVLERESAARVYLDGGHSDWLPVAVQAERLRAAGVARADGFVTNVSNYRRTSDELAYGARLRHLLGDHLEQVVDTSRNGAGPLGTLWCDPPGRRLGPAPTLRTGETGVAAYLWVNAPGEADGCAAPAGEFVPELAVELAGGGTPTSTPTPTPTPTPTSVRPPRAGGAR